MRLGVQNLCLFGRDSAILGQSTELTYIWMPLEASSAIKPTDDVLRIESPRGDQAAPIPQPIRRPPPVSEPTNNTDVQTESNGKPRKISRRKAALQDLAALIQQAEQLRVAQRENLVQTNALLKGLKQHRRQNRAIQNTLDSLKQLKTLGV
jgi:hypothetical protein